MLSEIFKGFALLALCVVVHATGLALALRRLESHPEYDHPGLPKATWMLVWVACWLLVLHLVEIALWALFYHWQRCLPDLETAFYFSGVTYATVGYGDIVLPQEWRILGPIEGLTGILMCGLSTGFFFVLVSRLHTRALETPGSGQGGS